MPDRRTGNTQWTDSTEACRMQPRSKDLAALRTFTAQHAAAHAKAARPRPHPDAVCHRRAHKCASHPDRA
ncbi:hypothetical protein [Streptomyces sp. NWU339]|uniref:hypothetical protein n=1 Tax=Streptomyces sp. NWU339 TaxID=2185284 RepID=UPI00215AAD4F|nr:hypothetical protein [Streptomyces sp. NWU339]